jgi:hypothetical protein
MATGCALNRAGAKAAKAANATAATLEHNTRFM